VPKETMDVPPQFYIREAQVDVPFSSCMMLPSKDAIVVSPGFYAGVWPTARHVYLLERSIWRRPHRRATGSARQSLHGGSNRASVTSRRGQLQRACPRAFQREEVIIRQSPVWRWTLPSVGGVGWDRHRAGVRITLRRMLLHASVSCGAVDRPNGMQFASGHLFFSNADYDLHTYVWRAVVALVIAVITTG